MNLPLLRFLSSLRLTVVLLALSMMLVFMATLAQTRLGIWEVMSRYIRTFVVWVPVGGRELPVFPGGWLLGGLLLVNLIAAHASRFTWSWRKAPLFTIHGGLVVLLLSELITGLFARETEMTLDEGAVALLQRSAAARGTRDRRQFVSRARPGVGNRAKMAR